MLDREEYIEQVYFFRTFRERLAENLSAQEILTGLAEEILTTTRLPYAVQFLATDLKHAGVMGPAFEQLRHYFTAFQGFVIRQAEEEAQRLTVPQALWILQREAEYKSGNPTPQGLFVYQFEALCRNRLGYADGLTAMAQEPLYDDDWRGFLSQIRRQLGAVEFADLVFMRSALVRQDQPLFGEKEGRIAKASLGREPLFLFAALQRQLQYPEVPRPRKRDEADVKLAILQQKYAELENRVKLVEGELRGTLDLAQLAQIGKPAILDEE